MHAALDPVPAGLRWGAALSWRWPVMCVWQAGMRRCDACAEFGVTGLACSGGLAAGQRQGELAQLPLRAAKPAATTQPSGTGFLDPLFSAI